MVIHFVRYCLIWVPLPTGWVRPKAEADCKGKADLERPVDLRVKPYSKVRPRLPTEPAAQTSVPLPLVRKE